MQCTTRTCILKLVIDLIKVDNRIHRDEINWLQSITQKYNFTPDDFRAAHAVSFREAINCLKQLNASARNKVVSLIEQIVSIDNDIDLNEQIVLSAIKLSLQENTEKRVCILSAETEKFDHYDKQLIYLEQKKDYRVNLAIEKNISSLRKQLDNIGIDFVYFPFIIKQYIRSLPFIANAAELLFPSFSSGENETAISRLQQYETSDFCSFIHRQMGDNADNFPFNAFYLLKIKDCISADRHTTDFLCLQCSENPGNDIQLLIDSLLLELPADTIPYEGCYRTFFEMLSEKSKSNYNLLLENDKFYLSGECKIPVTIQGAERKSLFALFLLHGENGISNKDFAEATSKTPLGQEIITLYRYFANEKSTQKIDEALAKNEEPDVILNLRDPGKRTSHIGFIKKAFLRIIPLKDPQIYYPKNIRGQYIYKIALPDNMKWAKLSSCLPEQPLSIRFFK